MQKSFSFKTHHFLTRLALSAGGNIDAINPYHIIKDCFYSDTITDLREVLLEACRAALTENYSWKEGSPGNLLYFYETLETLVEACFLVNAGKKHKKKWRKKTANVSHMSADLVLPCALTEKELADPFTVIQSFFEQHTLQQWKLQLHGWMQAGLSNYTVLDSLPAEDTIAYYHHLQKLLDACWYITVRLKKKTQA